MPVTGKPNRQAAEKPSEKAIEAFISKGGSVASEVAPKAKYVQHPLKFPADGTLFGRMESVRKAGTVQLPRNTWILQAIAEKLERETQ
ncbi:hypothetical protein [Pleomorphomonas koreensis]|jgi:hypothetical protein|uniref:hypothetical protein n=1 Tax=Pleomorphomonas koreensis TaxID=257440 RepID=UPI000A0082CB|nr:hypothetical protein [Pleomorphomonas koreensis]